MCIRDSYYTRKFLRYSYGAIVLMNILIVLALPFVIDVYSLSSQTGVMASDIIIYHAILAVLIWAPAFTLPNTLRAANDAVSYTHLSAHIRLRW